MPTTVYRTRRASGTPYLMGTFPRRPRGSNSSVLARFRYLSIVRLRGVRAYVPAKQPPSSFNSVATPPSSRLHSPGCVRSFHLMSLISIPLVHPQTLPSALLSVAAGEASGRQLGADGRRPRVFTRSSGFVEERGYSHPSAGSRHGRTAPSTAPHELGDHISVRMFHTDTFDSSSDLP